MINSGGEHRWGTGVASKQSHDKPGEAGASGIVGHIKKITAIIVAVTALIAALAALVVAAGSGWKQVGPVFKDFFAHGKVELSPTPSPSPTAAIDPALFEALNAKTHARREQARDALSQAISIAQPAAVDAIIERLSKSNDYREQIGIAEGLRRAPGGWTSTDPARSIERIRTVSARTSDQTLKAALDGAIRSARR